MMGRSYFTKKGGIMEAKLLDISESRIRIRLIPEGKRKYEEQNLISSLKEKELCARIDFCGNEISLRVEEDKEKIILPKDGRRLMIIIKEK
ncbi:MAG: hypothetical protein COT41_00555 [Candidatus Portnoybacteria bacterium CG08_land_8_20_14_0_20_40_83]|nr:MAG: hypothetical protein COT41_00555 [Candidatus Portnoybacteria bacterium CG08_land_8_20_14_0_20_40_83]